MRHVVAMGGGGFLGEGTLAPLDEFALSLADKAKPNVCFVPTAVGDDERYVAQFHEVFAGVAGKTADVTLFRRDTRALADRRERVSRPSGPAP